MADSRILYNKTLPAAVNATGNAEEKNYLFFFL
jgi:hypothetical protein